MIKSALKKILQTGFSNKSSTILIASMGRSGSTLVWEAVRTAKSKKVLLPQKISQRVVSGNAWDLSNIYLKPGIVYKTHALGHELNHHENVKVVFLYGPASDAALSVLSCRLRYGSDWITNHMKHLRASGNLDDIIKHDTFRFEEQIDSWLSKDGVSRVLINYEYLWSYETELSQFLDLEIKLPEKRNRESKVFLDQSVITQIKDNYSILDAKISKLPRFQILS